MKDLFNIHFILDGKLFFKKGTKFLPLVGDEIRLGNVDNEKFYVVTKRVWAYDEQDNLFERVNIGISEAL